MTFKDIHRRVVVETSGPVGKNVTSRVVHSGIRNYGKSLLHSSAEHVSSRGHSLLLPLSRACYNRRVRIAAERDALWERRPQQIIFRRTHYEWPKAKRASISARVGHFAAARNEERSMAGYGGVDFIDFDSQLNDEEKLVRQTARQFVENEIISIIEKHSREATFPKHLVPQLGELGFFGANLHGYGCAGMSNVAYGLMTQELERGDSGLRSFVSVQGALVMYPIYSYGSDAQKNKWLPLLQQGKAIGCFGLTEPQFGSNPGGMLTRAVKKGHKYVLNGEKMWITRGSVAHLDGENEQGGDRAGQGAQGARYSRCERHRRRLLRHAAHEQPRERVHLRGNERYSQAGDRRTHHRHRRICIKTETTD